MTARDLGGERPAGKPAGYTYKAHLRGLVLRRAASEGRLGTRRPRVYPPGLVRLICALALLACTGLLSWPASAQGSSVKASAPFTLVGGPMSDQQPAMAGNLMVFERCGNPDKPNCATWGMDLTTRQTFPISQGSWDEAQPTTDGVHVAWRDGRNSQGQSGDNLLNNLDIYWAHIDDKQAHPVTTAPRMQNHPSIWGNIAVWGDFRDARSSDDQEAGNIYMADLLSGQETLISGARSAQVRPITNGRYVVWTDYRNEPNPEGVNSDIYGYDLTTHQEFPISTAPDTQTDPAISGNFVVWTDFRKGTESDIYGYDLTTHQEFPICTAPGSQIQPAISGNIVVWRDYRNEPDKDKGTNSDIYGYDLTTHQEFPIYVGPGPQGEPAVDGNLVAWVDEGKGLADYDIMGATISGVTITTPPAPPLSIPGTGITSFPQTGKSISGIFRDYWVQHGGLAQQGYPISDLMREVSDLDGKTYTVQYFERAVFEYHPENKPPYNILLSQLGTFRYRQKYPTGTPFATPNNDPGSVLFPQTGKRLGGKFLQYWQTHGGLAQQGYPISDEFTETSDLDGKPYTVQYVERAVFELHPENAGTPYEVLLSQLGTFQYKAKYGGR